MLLLLLLLLLWLDFLHVPVESRHDAQHFLCASLNLLVLCCISM
jgi:hypothetical protein